MVEKVCALCGDAKPVAEFYTSKASCDGYRNRCKACWRSPDRIPKPSLAERLWSRVVIGDSESCWPWTGSTTRGGYGRIGFVSADGRKVWEETHRVSYRLTYGFIPDRMVVRHKCDNPRCANPKHLIAGTQKQNCQDTRDRGRLNTPLGSQRGSSKLTEEKVQAMRLMHASGASYASIGRTFEVSCPTAQLACKGITWRHVPPHQDSDRRAA